MKELLQQYVNYNAWANNELIKVLTNCTAEQLDMNIENSFSSIRKTAYHLWGAEDIWLQRLQLIERPIRTETSFEGGFEEAVRMWQECSQQLINFVDKQYDDAAFEHVVEYYNPVKKQPMKLPVYVVLMQVLNHATYHRGQLITMLRQAGLSKVPATDFMLYKMKKKR